MHLTKMAKKLLYSQRKVTSQNLKFVKLWNWMAYSERTRWKMSPLKEQSVSANWWVYEHLFALMSPYKLILIFSMKEKTRKISHFRWKWRWKFDSRRRESGHQQKRFLFLFLFLGGFLDPLRLENSWNILNGGTQRDQRNRVNTVKCTQWLPESVSFGCKNQAKKRIRAIISSRDFFCRVLSRASYGKCIFKDSEFKKTMQRCFKGETKKLKRHGYGNRLRATTALTD